MMVFFRALVLLIAAASVKSQLRIIGGIDAENGFAPYQVSLQTIYNGAHFCSGFILSERYIATAAHCFKKRKAKDCVVITGTTDLTRPGAKYYIEKAIMHSDFDSRTLHNDIGLLRLNSSIAWNSQTKAIKLPYQQIRPGTNVIVTGWGMRTKGVSVASTKLEKLTQSYIPYEKCQGMLGIGELPTGHICAKSKIGQGACKGDSGGPLVTKDRAYVVGIASYVDMFCATGSPDAYVSTFYFSDWINKNLNENND